MQLFYSLTYVMLSGGRGGGGVGLVGVGGGAFENSAVI